MQPITTELLKEQLSTRTAKKGAVWVLDLRGDEFGALGAEWGRRTLYEPGGAGWPLKRGRSTINKEQAHEWLEAYAVYLERERRGMLAQKNGMLLVTDGCAAYIAATKIRKGGRHSTTVNRASSIRCHIVPELGQQPLCALTHVRVADFLENLRVEPQGPGVHGKQPASIETQRYVLGTLSAVWKHSYPGEPFPWGTIPLVDGDAWHRRREAALSGEILGTDDYYTAEQLGHVLRTALEYDRELAGDPANRHKCVGNTAPYIPFMFYTTARRAEAELLRWHHIREDLGLVWIPGTKTHSAPRWVPLQDALRPWIDFLRATADGAPDPDDWVFPSSLGRVGPPSHDTLSNRVHRVLTLAGLKRFGKLTHLCRNSHTTLALLARYDRELIKAWMGHSHGDVLDRYTSPGGLAVQLGPEDRSYLPELVSADDFTQALVRPVPKAEVSRPHLRLIS